MCKVEFDKEKIKMAQISYKSMVVFIKGGMCS